MNEPSPHARIRQNLPCPLCGYNLRGMTGAVTHCPECGGETDVDRLPTAYVRHQIWQYTPEFGALWLVIVGTVLLVPALGLVTGANSRLTEPAIIGVAMALGVWLGSWGFAWQRLGTIKALGACLALHLCTGIYFAGMLATVLSLGLAFSDTGFRLVALIVPPLALALIYGAGRLQSAVGRFCFRRHLMRHQITRRRLAQPAAEAYVGVE